MPKDMYTVQASGYNPSYTGISCVRIPNKIMDTLLLIDNGLVGATRIFFLILGAWGFVRSVRGMNVDGSYLGSLAIGEFLYIALLIMDGILYFGGIIPDNPSLHYLYAIFATLLLPFIYIVTLRGDDSNRAQWIYTFATVFLWGLAFRIITTGTPL